MTIMTSSMLSDTSSRNFYGYQIACGDTLERGPNATRGYDRYASIREEAYRRLVTPPILRVMQPAGREMTQRAV